MSNLCEICPRNCRTDRAETTAFCLMPERAVVAHIQAHFWEEPPISGTKGSGTVFFSGCNMRCVYCQNHGISSTLCGKTTSDEMLAKLFLELMASGVHNINLVTPTHFSGRIATAIRIARKSGLSIPVIWNSNAYEKVETLKMLEGLVDIYLPDFRYFNDDAALRYSRAHSYSSFAKSAILEMFRQVSHLEIRDGVAVRGLLVRILVLPGDLNDCGEILKWIAQSIGVQCHISLMGQYYPAHLASEYPELNRQISQNEYEKIMDFALSLGFEDGYFQEVGSSSDWTPNFCKA